MSFNLVHTRTHTTERPAWSGAAFIVEALFLLVFLAASSAVFVQLFAQGAQQGAESLQLSRAVALASNTAERFAANPEDVATMVVEDDMTVVCLSEEHPHERGTLITASIYVYEFDAAYAAGANSGTTAAAAGAVGSSGASQDAGPAIPGAPQFVPQGKLLYSTTTAHYEREVGA